MIALLILMVYLIIGYLIHLYDYLIKGNDCREGSFFIAVFWPIYCIGLACEFLCKCSNEYFDYLDKFKKNSQAGDKDG